MQIQQQHNTNPNSQLQAFGFGMPPQGVQWPRLGCTWKITVLKISKLWILLADLVDRGKAAVPYIVKIPSHSQQAQFISRTHFVSSWLCSNPLFFAFLSSFYIFLSLPKHHQKRCYCNGLLCIFEYTSLHLSTPCPHLVPPGRNMIMATVNVFAKEAFTANGA